MRTHLTLRSSHYQAVEGEYWVNYVEQETNSGWRNPLKLALAFIDLCWPTKSFVGATIGSVKSCSFSKIFGPKNETMNLG